jgi:hypothetical protein
MDYSSWPHRYYPGNHVKVRALGSLAVLQYVQDPNVFYCSDQQRPDGGWINLNRPGSKNWEILSQQGTAFGDPNGTHPYNGTEAGYTHYFYVFPYKSSSNHSTGVFVRPNGIYYDAPHYTPDKPYGHGKVKELTFDDIASRSDRLGYTPLIASCVNNHSGFSSHFNTASGEVDGINGVFHDGSVRWISRDEAARIAAKSNDPDLVNAAGAPHDILKNTRYDPTDYPFEYIARNGLRITAR